MAKKSENDLKVAKAQGIPREIAALVPECERSLQLFLVLPGGGAVPSASALRGRIRIRSKGVQRILYCSSEPFSSESRCGGTSLRGDEPAQRPPRLARGSEATITTTR